MKPRVLCRGAASGSDLGRRRAACERRRAERTGAAAPPVPAPRESQWARDPGPPVPSDPRVRRRGPLTCPCPFIAGSKAAASSPVVKGSATRRRSRDCRSRVGPARAGRSDTQRGLGGRRSPHSAPATTGEATLRRLREIYSGASTFRACLVERRRTSERLWAVETTSEPDVAGTLANRFPTRRPGRLGRAESHTNARASAARKSRRDASDRNAQVCTKRTPKPRLR